jgi:hypothetical protein
MLETYEVPAAFLAALDGVPTEQRGQLRLRAESADVGPDLAARRHSGLSEGIGKEAASAPQAAVAVRKADHRRQYWEYAGPISGGRGRLAEVGRGSLTGDRAARFVLRLLGFGPE